MAIMGVLVHALKDEVDQVEQMISRMECMTTYGVHQDQYIVVVIEAPSGQIDDEANRLENLDGVLCVYATYMTVEDEMDEEGNLETEVDLNKLFGKKRKFDIQ